MNFIGTEYNGFRHTVCTFQIVGYFLRNFPNSVFYNNVVIIVAIVIDAVFYLVAVYILLALCRSPLITDVRCDVDYLKRSKEAIEARTTEISKYLTKELQDLNADTIRTDIPTSATVTNVLVWNVEQSGTNDFTVAYEVDQQVKEGEQTQAVTENYTVTVYVDKDGAMVITQNPTLAPAVQKSKYEPKVQEADVSVSSNTVKDATAFLETFFKLYPTATEKELAYYVKDGVLAPVSGDYVFSELVNPVFTKDGDNLKVSVSVKYLDNKSKMTQISQYELVLHKDDNWKIVE